MKIGELRTRYFSARGVDLSPRELTMLLAFAALVLALLAAAGRLGAAGGGGGQIEGTTRVGDARR